MKALVYHAPNDMRLEEVPTPYPAENEVRLKIRAVGICGSDLHGYLGITGRRTPPMTMGHEFTGEVNLIGEGVTHLKQGDRVACYPVDFCGSCEMCRSGQEHLCGQRRQFGVLSCNGALADYLCVPAKVCFPLDASVSYEIGTLMEPLAVSYRAVCHAENLQGKHVLIVGAGTIGLLTLACAVGRNPKSITVLDLSDHRLAVAKQMGATHLVNPGQEDALQSILMNTEGKGADVSFEAVGAKPTAAISIAALRTGGTAIWIGNNQPQVEINMQQVVTRELKIQGTFLYSLEDFRAVTQKVNRQELHLAPIVNRIEPMAEGCGIFAELSKNLGTTLKCVLVQNEVEK